MGEEIEFDVNKEIWKPIRSTDNMYEVSNFGRVRSLPRTSWNPRGNGFWFTTKGKVLTQKMYGSKIKYPHVMICTSKIKSPMIVHRFVAEEFIGDIPDGMVVNHKDGNTSNNHVDNLEIITYSENKYHSIHVLKTKFSFTQNNRLRITDVESNEEKYYINSKEASKELGCCMQNIRLYARGVWKGLYKGKYKIEEVK